ncbi:hypothetical protein [Paenarthrobacter sp. NCHU4564]|uniref:hypothetical protein n=1 Tax=Paenarthrobacter sp. NCHU4564 TaxID=3451353 RepID=UPI003F9AF400
MALVICWIPILNILALLMGLAAPVLGVIALGNGKRLEQSLKSLAIAAVVIGGGAFIGSIVTFSSYGSSPSDSAKANEPGGSASLSPAPSPSGSVSASPTPSVTPTPSVSAGSASHPHPIGTVALLGREYRAAVTGVKLNANADVLANNRYNDPPEGQYVLVDIAVTYVGAREGTPWLDLSPTFVGSDARQYDGNDCGASLTNGEMDVPTLEAGGSATYQVCMDVPPGAIEGGKIFLENDWSFRDQRRTYWALQ